MTQDLRTFGDCNIRELPKGERPANMDDNSWRPWMDRSSRELAEALCEANAFIHYVSGEGSPGHKFRDGMNVALTYAYIAHMKKLSRMPRTREVQSHIDALKRGRKKWRYPTLVKAIVKKAKETRRPTAAAPDVDTVDGQALKDLLRKAQ